MNAHDEYADPYRKEHVKKLEQALREARKTLADYADPYQCEKWMKTIAAIDAVLGLAPLFAAIDVAAKAKSKQALSAYISDKGEVSFVRGTADPSPHGNWSRAPWLDGEIEIDGD